MLRAALSDGDRTRRHRRSLDDSDPSRAPRRRRALPRASRRVARHCEEPADRPAAHFNYLSDPFDLCELVEAVKVIRELISQPAFDEFRGMQIEPGPDLRSDRDIEAWVRATTSTDYHPSCSCRMGKDEDAVVDAEMKVHGIDGLRVVDASVMPRIVSGNLNAPTQMIAERAADFIRGREQLAPLKAGFHFEQN